MSETPEDVAERPIEPLRLIPLDGDRAETIAAVIRNGLSNGPIAQSQATWDHLQTRLGEIACAILKEI